MYPQANVLAIHRIPADEDFDCAESCKPRTQKLRFEEDHYTPKWIRKTGQAREGWCSLCPGNGRWLQMKNSAFWYHRQFQHGVSSVSGHFFVPPLKVRQADTGDKIEGLCASCGLVSVHSFLHPSMTQAEYFQSGLGSMTIVAKTILPKDVVKNVLPL
ncbi:hypothetical protein T439DRAFT_293860 [Meredithblackwellia eburnea MCA 4105]